MGFCIPEPVANSILKAAQKGEFDIGTLYDMKPEARRNFFAKFADVKLAKQMNAAFDEAKISNQVDSLEKWANRVFTSSQKKEESFADVLRKIQDLDKLGVLTPENSEDYMEDLVASKVGVNVTPNEAFQIEKRAKELQKEFTKESKFGTPTSEYFKLRRDMNNFLDSLTPASQLRVLSQTFGRGMLLASIKSPLLNIESNTIQGFATAAQRRISERAFGGVNKQFGREFQKFNNKVFKESGFDTARMFDFQDQKLIRGEQIGTSQGPGKIRKASRFVEDIVFKKMQGAPDVFFSGIAFSDRANIVSTKIARGEGLKGKALKTRSLDIFKDATRIDPKTQEGQDVRDAAIADAMYSTFTNKSAASTVSLGIRKIFNLASGDLRIGDQRLPFVRTPANVISAGIDSSGVLIPPKTAIKMFNSLNQARSKGLQESFGKNFEGFGSEITRAGLGLTFAFLVSQLFEPDEFIGEFPSTQKERELLAAKEATTNSVKIQGRWVSLDYFSVLAAPIVGMLNAKKHGDTLSEKILSYYAGVFAQVKRLPGLDEFGDLVDSINELGTSRSKFGDKVEDTANFLINFVSSRSIPSIVSDVARGVDPVRRKTNKATFDKLFVKVPFLRESLPERQNVFGEPISEQNAVSTLLFGQRVRKANTNSVIQELDRLLGTGNLPSITDVEKTSSRAKTLKAQIGEKDFAEAKSEFGKNIFDKFSSEIKRSSYKKLSDEEKKNVLDKIKRTEFEKMLKRAGFKKK